MLRHTLLSAALLALCAGAMAASPPTLVAYAPYGHEIAVAGPTGLHLVDLARGAESTVSTAGPCASPCWSPNGRMLLFLERTAGPLGRLMLYTPANGKTRPIASYCRGPMTWREDSGRFAVVQEEQPGHPVILWYSLRENGVTWRVTFPVEPAWPSNDALFWIPTTDNLAVIGKASNGGDAYIIDGGQIERASTSGDLIGAGFGANHKDLIWARRGPNLRYILLSLYQYDMMLRSVKKLDFPARVAALNPNPRKAPAALVHACFSPTGRAFVLVVREAAAGKAAGGSLAAYAMKLDGSNARLLLRVPASESIAVAWSPDGRQVALSDVGATTTRTLLCDPATGGSKPLGMGL